MNRQPDDAAVTGADARLAGHAGALVRTPGGFPAARTC
jgi:hypothetical protein